MCIPGLYQSPSYSSEARGKRRVPGEIWDQSESELPRKHTLRTHGRCICLVNCWYSTVAVWGESTRNGQTIQCTKMKMCFLSENNFLVELKMASSNVALSSILHHFTSRCVAHICYWSGPYKHSTDCSTVYHLTLLLYFWQTVGLIKAAEGLCTLLKGTLIVVPISCVLTRLDVEEE